MERKISKRFVKTSKGTHNNVPTRGAAESELEPHDQEEPFRAAVVPHSMIRSCSVCCVSPEGYECKLDLVVDGVDDLARVMRELSRSGFLPGTIEEKLVPAVFPKSGEKPRIPRGNGAPPWCEDHDCSFRLFTKNGRRWWAHYHQGSGRWCNSTIPVPKDIG